MYPHPAPGPVLKDRWKKNLCMRLNDYIIFRLKRVVGQPGEPVVQRVVLQSEGRVCEL